MQQISFSDEESAKLREMVTLYDPTKAVILFAEEISPRNITLPQIMKELRDALDHLMRVVADKVVPERRDDSGYGGKNLDKAFGHLYRAAYDALDWVSIILRARIDTQLSKYSTSAIEASLPDYYPVIKPRLEGFIPEKIAQIRANKDIGAPDPQSIQEYAGLVKEMKDYWQKVVAAEPSLIDYAKKETGGKRKERIIIGLITAACVALGVLLTKILS